MLYTVVPLEQIYRCRTNINQTKWEQEEDAPEYKNIGLEFGTVRAKRDGEHYVVDTIYSTNMNDYLDTKLAPGSRIERVSM